MPGLSTRLENPLNEESVNEEGLEISKQLWYMNKLKNERIQNQNRNPFFSLSRPDLKNERKKLNRPGSGGGTSL